MKKHNIYKNDYERVYFIYGLFGVTTVVAYEPPSQNVVRSEAI